MMGGDRFATSRGRIARLAGCLSLSILLLTTGLAHAAATVENIRVRPSPERTRIVFDLSNPVEHRIFSLENPARLVIDIEDAASKAALDVIELGNTPIHRLRAATRAGDDLRVVLDLRERVKPRSFVLKPIMQYGDRLVIDLYTDAQQETVVRRLDAPASKMRDVVIAIDAGHGGDDPGAIGPGNLFEKDVVLGIARELATLFEKQPGYRPILIRNDDYFLGLRERTEIARGNQADVFLSIHADAFKTPEAKGASVYALSQRGATSETARWLAEKENRADLIGGAGGVSLGDKDDLLAGVLLDLSMTASLSASLEMGQHVLDAIKPINRLHKRQVEQAAFSVLKSPDIPSLLVETGFISNPQEAAKLKTRRHQRAMANAIFYGVKRYVDENPPSGSFLAWKKQGQDDTLASYKIERGDTLSDIALKYRVSAEDLKRVNGLDTDMIRIGQVLKIPAS